MEMKKWQRVALLCYAVVTVALLCIVPPMYAGVETAFSARCGR